MSQVTVTGKAGPGIAVTAQVFTDILSFEAANSGILTLFTNSGIRIQVDIAGKTTFTVTAVGSAAPMSYTVSIS